MAEKAHLLGPMGKSLDRGLGPGNEFGQLFLGTGPSQESDMIGPEGRCLFLAFS